LNAQLKSLMKQEREKLESEKDIIKKDMKNKEQTIEQLKKDLAERDEKILMLETKLPSDEKEMKNRLLTYQKNMEQLTLMYHSLASQKNLQAKDNKIFEKKLLRRNE